MTLYAYPLARADAVGEGCDNGRFHFRIGLQGITLLNRAGDACDTARAHPYWQNAGGILSAIEKAMPQKDPPEQPSAPLDALIASIAVEDLGVPTLAIRNSDSLDFHDIAVWKLAAALRRAYQAGCTSAARQHK